MAPAAIMKVLHNVEEDYPDTLKREIADAVGDISHIEIEGEEVLVAAFIQSPYFGKTRMLKGEKEQNEDKWQSKCMLVINVGNGVVASCTKYKRRIPQPGDWVFGDVKEHFQLSIHGIGSKSWMDEKDPTRRVRPWSDGGWPCRMVLVGDIRGYTTRPQDIM